MVLLACDAAEFHSMIHERPYRYDVHQTSDYDVNLAGIESAFVYLIDLEDAKF